MRLRTWAGVLSASIGLLGGCNAILGNDEHPTRANSTAPDDASRGADDATVADGAIAKHDAAGRDATTDATLDGGAGDGASDAPPDAPDAATLDASGAPDVATCTPGGACAPNECQTGSWVCDGGARVCQEASQIDAGTPCGAGGDAGAHVCNAGECVACSAGADCSDPAAPCVKRTYDCSSGSAVCKASANACHVGKVTACTGGVPTCTDQGTSAAAGAACPAAGGASGVCDGNGGCVACTPNAQCNPNGNPCQLGVQSCSAGFQCNGASNVLEGQVCGGASSGQICHNGACVACSAASCPGGCCDATLGCVLPAAQSTSRCGTGASGGACHAW